MKKLGAIYAIIALVALLVPDLAFAQDGTKSLFSDSFAEGFMHPILGIDHLMSMVCVGVISAQIGGRAIWLVPVTFVCLLGAGGALGIMGVHLPAVESVIALSVIALGAAIVAEQRFPIYLTMVLVGLFGLFHGHAHGVEMPSMAQPFHYALGFMLASASIHVIGLGIGEFMTKTTVRAITLRIAGATVLLTGVLLFTNMI